MTIDTSKLSILERNILSVYLKANDADIVSGMTWYARANAVALRLFERYEVSIYQVCGVISALSPRNKWSTNIRDAELVIRAWKAGETEVNGVFACTANVAKAFSILNGESCEGTLQTKKNRGNKTLNFYRLILNPSDAFSVCIDSHAVDIADDELKSENRARVFQSSKKYETYAESYRNVAAQLEILPSQLQAITWVTHRRIAASLEDQF